MRRNKWILTTLLTTSSSMFLPLACCSNGYSMSELTKNIISEMIGTEDGSVKGICSIPRPSTHCKLINEYLQSRIWSILGEETNIPIHTDIYNNLWCDIPAHNPQNKDFKPIILQAHIDMVVAGLTEEESLTKGIVPQIDGKFMHSRNYETSLGADNAIGISIILEIMKNYETFEHGVIRCIFTADEEVGLIGAHNISVEAIKLDGKFIPYLINLDNEVANQICRSCLGSFRNKYYRTYPTPAGQAPFSNAIDLRIDGLKGGHSGVDIVLGRACADRIMFEFINYLINTKNVDVEIGTFDHVKKVDGKDVDIKWQSNQLIQNARVILYCNNCDVAKVREYLNEYLDTLPTRYPGEDVGSWSTSVSSTLWHEDNPYIEKDRTKKLAKLIGSNIDPLDTEKIEEIGFPYGVLDKWDDGRAKASVNIGPISITSEPDVERNIFLTIGIMFRTGAFNKEEDPNPQKWSIGWTFDKYNDAAYNVDQIEYENFEQCQPWEIKEGVNDQLIDYLVTAYGELGTPAEIFDPQGGMEIAKWITKNPDLRCACIGAAIDDAHTQKETLHLDTIDNLYNVVLKAIDWMSIAPDTHKVI